MLSIFSCAFWPAVCHCWWNVHLGLLSMAKHFEAWFNTILLEKFCLPLRHLTKQQGGPKGSGGKARMCESCWWYHHPRDQRFKNEWSHISCSHFHSHSRIHLITKHGVRLPRCSCLWPWTCSLDLECFSHIPVSFFQEGDFSDHPAETTVPQHPHKNTLAPSYLSICYFFHDTVTVWYDICVYVCIYSFIHSLSHFRNLVCLIHCCIPAPQNDPLHPAGIQQIQIVVYCRCEEFVHFPSLQLHPCLPYVWYIKGLSVITPVKNWLSSQTSV